MVECSIGVMSTLYVTSEMNSTIGLLCVGLDFNDDDEDGLHSLVYFCICSSSCFMAARYADS